MHKKRKKEKEKEGTYSKLNLPLFNYSYRKCMFVDFLIGYTNPPNGVH
jgi:hypothetical protein